MPPRRRPPPVDPIEQEAAGIVAAEFDPREQELARAIEAIRQQFAQAEANQQTYGREQTQFIGGIYDQLTNQLGRTMPALQRGYGQGTQAVGDIYDEALQTIGGATGAVQQQLESDAQRLGIQTALGDPLARLRASMGQLQGLLTVGKANRQSGLIQEGVTASRFAQEDVNRSVQEKTAQQRDVQQNVGVALARLGQGKTRAETEFGRKISDLRGLRSTALSNTIRELKAAQAQAEAEAEKEEYRRQLDLARLDMEAARLGISQQQLDVSRGHLDIARKKSMNILEGLPSEANVRRGTSDLVRNLARRYASPLTYSAFRHAVKNPNLEQALRHIDDHIGRYQRGVNVGELKDWVSRYYQPRQSDVDMLLGRIPLPPPKPSGKANIFSGRVNTNIGSAGMRYLRG